MAPHFRTGKLFLIMLLMVCTIPLASSASSQHHPFSEIFPPDTNLGFGDQALENASSLELQNGFNFTDYTIYDQGNTKLLEWNQSTSKWEVRNADLDLNSRSITNLATPTSGSGAATKSYVDNNDDTGTDSQDLGYSNDNAPTGSYATHTVTITGGSNTGIRDYYESNTDNQGLPSVLNNDNTANQNINMNGNDLNNAGDINPDSITYSDGYEWDDLSVDRLYPIAVNNEILRDHFAFNPPAVAEYKSSGSWTSTSIPTSLFKGGRAGSETIQNGWDAYRLEWQGLDYDFYNALSLAHSTAGNSMKVQVETSDDGGSTWRHEFNTSSLSSWPGYSMYKHRFKTKGSRDRIRMTFYPTWNNANDIGLRNIRYFGAYSQYEDGYLYEWDANKNIDLKGNLDLGSHKITSLADPTNAQDAATKSYVDNNDATGTDDQNLEEVLTQGNTATGHNIHLDNGGNKIKLNPGDGSLEITRSSSNAYIDLKNDTGEDYDIRLQRTAENTLSLEGGNLYLNGNAIQSADWSNANDLNSGGGISDFSNANDLDSSGNIADFSAANDLDGNGNLGSGTVSDNEISDNTVDNSEIQNGASFTFNGITSNGDLDMNGNSIYSGSSDAKIRMWDNGGRFIFAPYDDGSWQWNRELDYNANQNKWGFDNGADFGGGTLTNIGGLNGCGGNQFVDGNGNCDTDTDSQNLGEVLSQGNAARGSTAIVDRFYADDHGIGGTPGISLAVGDTDTGLHSDTDGRLEFWTNAGERFSLTNSELKSQGASLNMNGNPITNADWSNANDLNSGGGISDFSNANDLDGSGNLNSNTVGINEVTDEIADSKNSANLGSSGGWYRIASNGPVSDGGSGGDRAAAKFIVQDTKGGQHSTTVFYASVHFGNEPTLNLVSRSSFSSDGLIEKVRLVEGDTYEGAAVEVYVDGEGNSGPVEYRIYNDVQNGGWSPVNWNSGSVPTGFSTTVLDLTDAPVLATAANTNNDQFKIDRSGNLDLSGQLTVGGYLEMNQNQIKQPVIDKRSSDPSSPAVGQMWYRTDLD